MAKKNYVILALTISLECVHGVNIKYITFLDRNLKKHMNNKNCIEGVIKSGLT